MDFAESLPWPVRRSSVRYATGISGDFDSNGDRIRRSPFASPAGYYIHFLIYFDDDILRTMNISPETLFSALAHGTRLRCLVLLLRHEELCVCELTYAIGAAQPHISRHLAQLREIGLVSDRRQGLWIHYRLHPQLPGWVNDVLEATADGVGQEAPFASDEQAIAAMPNRPGAPRCA
jgi:ArsR family transcriptional regulator